MTMETILKFFGIQRATPQNRSWCIFNYGSVDDDLAAASDAEAEQQKGRK